jgi:hypothetical protein
MAVARAELVFHPLTFTMVYPYVRSVHEFIIGADVGSAVGGMFVLGKPFELNPLFKHIALTVKDVHMTHSGVVVNVNLKHGVPSKGNVEVPPVVGPSGPLILVKFQLTPAKTGKSTGRAVGIVSTFEAKHLSNGVEVEMTQSTVGLL